MRALIVGCGYVGLPLGAELVRLGHEVHGLRRTAEGEAALKAAGIQPLVGDVTKVSDLAALPGPYDWVVNCVSSTRGGVDEYRSVYLQGTKNLIEWLAAAPPKKFVYTSSTSVYGQTGGGEVDENAATEPLDESGRVVLEAEQLLRRERPRAMILRHAGIYGPGRMLRRTAALEAREPIAADPAAWLNLIHVDDGVAAILAAEMRGHAGDLYNVSDDHPVRRGEYYRELALLQNAPPPTFAPASDKANRRIISRRLRDELGVTLRYPSYVEGLAASCRRGRELGHLGRAAIHPDQLPVIEQAYLPTASEVDRAQAGLGFGLGVDRTVVFEGHGAVSG